MRRSTTRSLADLRFATLLVLAFFAFANAVAARPPQDELATIQSELWEALGLVYADDWTGGLEAAERTLDDAGRALDGVAEDSDEARTLAEYVGRAQWAAARCEYGLGRTAAALQRLSDGADSKLPLEPQTRSLFPSLSAAILIELGLPDLAREPAARARQLCNDGIADGFKRDYGAFFDANLSEVRRALAIGDYDGALEALVEMERRFDWANAAAKMNKNNQPNAADARRAQIEVLRGTALAGSRTPDSKPSAAAAFERARAIAAAFAQDRFTACASLLELALAARDFERARAELRRIDEGREAGQFDLLSASDEAWLAALRVRLARVSSDDHRAMRGDLLVRFEALLEEWRGVDRPGGVGFLRFARPRMLLVELLIGASPDEALSIAAGAQQFGVLWRRYGEPRPSAAQLRSTLCDGDTGCLVYVTGADEGVLLVVERDGTHAYPLPSVTWIDEHVRSLRSASSSTNASQANAAAKLESELVDELLPAEARKRIARWKHVRLVGREQIAGASFQSLRVFDGRPLGATHAVSDLPSLPVGWALLERRGKRPERERCTLIGAPQPAASVVARYAVLKSAPLTSGMLAPLIEALPSDRHAHRLAANATVGALAAARELGSVVFVVAHGMLDPLRELRPMIALTPDAAAPDGLLTVERARALAAPDVVVLCVCRSADGVERLGDVGASDFGGAFLLAGASSVVVADGELRLSDALAIGRTLQARLSAGDSVAEALRRAYAELAARSPGRSLWGLPYVFGLGL